MASNTPPAPAESPVTQGSWLSRNLTTIISVGIGAFLLYYLFFKDAEDKVDVAINITKVVFGLGLIIFIHELGHFLAAKWCDVYVRTFSIGFGPPLLGVCQFKWGETTYKIGWIPLGGFVQMMGEGEENEENTEDPRSYKNKKVWQRMIIISAGVTMNLILGWLCYTGVLLTRGIDLNPGVVGSVAPGGPAWKAGMRGGSHIRQIGDREDPHYKELQRVVMRNGKDNPLPITFETFEDGKMVRRETQIAPMRSEDVLAPMLLIRSSSVSTLTRKVSGLSKPCQPGSPADRAEPAFQFRDRIVAMTDPDNPEQITPLRRDPRYPDQDQPDYYDLNRRWQRLADQPVTVRVERSSGETANIRIDRAIGKTIGLRMRMGQVVALRDGSTAATEGIRAREAKNAGDTLHVVEVTQSDGSTRRFSAEPKNGDQPLDPLLLPVQLGLWAATNPSDWSVRVTVKRREGHGDVDKTFSLQWDKNWDLIERSPAGGDWPVDFPMGIGALGIAYEVSNVVADVDSGSPGAVKGLKGGDEIKAVELQVKSRSGKVTSLKRDLKENQWAYFGSFIRETTNLDQVVLTINQDEQKVALAPVEDSRVPLVDRGLVYEAEKRTLKGDGVLDAMSLAGKRVLVDMMTIYENLAGMIRGRLSVKAISGPITIAKHSFDLAGRDTIEFILFIAFFNVNLAVVNFLPIPVLDGGHMVFLIYESLRGRPPSDRWRFILTILGLIIVLGLMILGLALDFGRHLLDPLKELVGL